MSTTIGEVPCFAKLSKNGRQKARDDVVRPEHAVWTRVACTEFQSVEDLHGSGAIPSPDGGLLQRARFKWHK
jgi:hypothetical protein